MQSYLFILMVENPCNRAGEPLACAQNGRREDLHGTQHSLLSQFFFISLAQPASLYCEQYVYIYISDCIDIVYELLLLPNNTASETFLYKLGGLQSVDWIFYHWHGSLAVTG